MNGFFMITRLYYTVFGQSLPESGLLFLQKIKDAGFGFLGASFFSFLLTLAAARMLGPALFGEVQYLLAISSVMVIFPLFGLNLSMMKLLHKESTKEEESRVLKAGTLFMVINNLAISLLFTSVFFSIGIPFFDKNSAGSVVFLLFFLWLLSFRFLCQSALQAKEEFKRFSRFMVVGAGVGLGFFFVASALTEPGFFTYAIAILLSHLIFCALFFLSKRDLLFSSSFLSKAMLSGLYQISLPAFFAVLLGVLFQQLDKLFIQSYFDAHVLGIYTAYLSLAFMIVSLPMTILNHVIMPTFAHKKVTPELMKLLWKALLIGSPVVFGISFMVMLTGELLYGAAFHVSMLFQLLFSSYAVLFCSTTFFMSLLSVSLQKGFLTMALLNGAAIFLYTIGFFLFAPRFGIEGALLSQVIVLFFFSLASLFLMKREAIPYAQRTL